MYVCVVVYTFVCVVHVCITVSICVSSLSVMRNILNRDVLMCCFLCVHSTLDCMFFVLHVIYSGLIVDFEIEVDQCERMEEAQANCRHFCYFIAVCMASNAFGISLSRNLAYPYPSCSYHISILILVKMLGPISLRLQHEIMYWINVFSYIMLMLNHKSNVSGEATWFAIKPQ